MCAAGPALFYLEVGEGKLSLAADTSMEHEVACIDVTPLGDDQEIKSELAAVGLWTDISVRLLKLPSLEEVAKEYLGGGE